jgi:hypothetical protein
MLKVKVEVEVKVKVTVREVKGGEGKTRRVERTTTAKMESILKG